MVALDNFGIFLAAHFRILSSGTSGIVLRNTSGVGRAISIYGGNSQSLYNDSNDGTIDDRAQVGQGVTPVSRSDIAIETPFGSSPESGNVISIPGGYNPALAKVEISTTITPTGGSGTITEVVKIQNIIVLITQNPEFFAFFRDIISPGKSFNIAETINLTYEITI